MIWHILSRKLIINYKENKNVKSKENSKKEYSKDK